MQTSIQELEKEAARLLKQAETLRAQERLAAIKQIKELATKYEITAAELNLAAPTRIRHVAPETAKYRGPNGELWGGGRGRKPDWVRKALDAGESLDKYAITTH